MLASCSQDLTNDLIIGGSDSQTNSSWSGDGILVEAYAEDVTRVSTNVDGNQSYLTWEAGDEITLVHNGAAYVYVAQQAGRTSTFAPKDDANALTTVDTTAAVSAFYNVTNVDATKHTATFNIEPKQTEGTLSNKLPLYSYAATTAVENGKIVIIMKPMASVVEFELSASSSWNADTFYVGRASRQQYTYAAALNITVDAAAGVMDTTTASLGSSVTLTLASMHDFATKRTVKVVVPGTTAYYTSGDNTTIYQPLYHGRACVKLYKGGNENFRRTIWNAYTPNIDPQAVAVNETKHIYQPLKDILDGHKNGIRTAEDMKAFADAINYSVETYPCGAGFCNEDGVVLLHNDISLAQYTDWLAIGNNYTGTLAGVETQFCGHFDGQNHTISDLKSVNDANDQVEYLDYDGKTVRTCPWIACGLFGALSGGSIKNLTVKGDIKSNYYTPEDEANWCYMGSIVAHHFGGVVENCTSYVNLSVGQNTKGKLRIGGIVARMSSITGVAKLINCHNYGTINLQLQDAATQAQYVGGIAGFVGDGESDLVFENCTNHGNITVANVFHNSRIGGVAGYIDHTDTIDHCTFKNLVNNGNITIGTTNTNTKAVYYGGVVAHMVDHTLEGAVNSGNITFTSLNAAATVAMGGVVGRASTNSADYSVGLLNCVNTGNVTAGQGENFPINKGWFGGIVGCSHASSTIDGCVNFGTVKVDTTQTNATEMFTGGILGLAGWSSNNIDNAFLVQNCTNYGIVELARGGVTEGTGWRFSGGIAGMLYGGSGVKTGTGAIVQNCNNYGTVRTTDGLSNIIGGVIGALWYDAAVRMSNNHGNVVSEHKLSKGWEAIGGVVGYIYTKETATTILACNNTGLVGCRKRTVRDLGESSDNIHVVMGGIQGGYGCAGATLARCKNTGKILGPHDALHTWNASNEVWDVSGGVNFVYRAAFVAHPNANLVCNNNIIGGSTVIGTLADADPTSAETDITLNGTKYKYTALTYASAVEHTLNDDPASDWYWKKWRHGYKAIPATSKNTTTFEPLQ